MKLIILALALVGSAFATETVEPPKEVQMNYPYLSLGLGPAPIPLPIFGAGYRVQRSHHGFDASVNAATVYAASAIKTSALYHYYFKPNPCSQFYTGVGPAAGFGFCRHGHTKFAGAAEFAFGKQYTNDTGDIRYFQADIDFPLIVGKKPSVHAVPIVVLKYGIGF